MQRPFAFRKFTGCRLEMEWKAEVEKAIVRQQAGTLDSRLWPWALWEMRADCIRVEVAAGRMERSRWIHGV